MNNDDYMICKCKYNIIYILYSYCLEPGGATNM